MRVTRDWLKAFNEVMEYGKLSASDVEECKQEARENEAWALEYYPRAAAMIREMQDGGGAEPAARD